MHDCSYRVEVTIFSPLDNVLEYQGFRNPRDRMGDKMRQERRRGARSRRMPSQTTFLFLCPSELHRRGDFVYARFSNHGAFVPKKMDVFYAQYLHRYSSSGMNCSHPQTRN